MDIYELTQIVLVLSCGLVLARLGIALARRIERRPATTPELGSGAEDRLRSLEEEATALRSELAELYERQDFTERLLREKPSSERALPIDREERRVVTPR